MKNYIDFLNESGEVLLENIPELSQKEVDNIKKYGYLTAKSLYSIITIKPTMKDDIMLSLGIDNKRYEEIIDIIKSNIDPIERKEIEDYIPQKHGMGAILDIEDGSFFVNI